MKKNHTLYVEFLLQPIYNSVFFHSDVYDCFVGN